MVNTELLKSDAEKLGISIDDNKIMQFENQK